LLQTAEIAALADARSIAKSSALAALNAVSGSSRRHHSVAARSHRVLAHLAAADGKLTEAWKAISRALAISADQKPDKLVTATHLAVAALIKPNQDGSLVGAAARVLGVRGDAVYAAILDYADWYLAAGRPSEALHLYELTQHSTEFDRLVGDIEIAPRRVPTRWALRAQRHARAITGQLHALHALNTPPSDALVKRAIYAAAPLTFLNQAPQRVQLLCAIVVAQAGRAQKDSALAALTDLEATESAHAYVVLDDCTRKQWQAAVSRARTALAAPATSNILPESGPDSTWLTGGGLQCALTGLELARSLDGVLDVGVDALRQAAIHLNEHGRHEEALTAIGEALSLHRAKYGDGLALGASRGWILWRHSMSLNKVGRTDESLQSAVDSLRYFRSGTTHEDRKVCALVVAETSELFIAEKRFVEALPLALESRRRYEDLDRMDVVNGRKTMLAIAKVYAGLGRHHDSALAYTNIARLDRGEQERPSSSIARQAISMYVEAARQYVAAAEQGNAMTAYQSAYQILDEVEVDPELADWAGWTRYRVCNGLAIAKISAEDQCGEALSLFREAERALRAVDHEPDPESDPTRRALWLEHACTLLCRLGDCLEDVQGSAGSDSLSWPHHDGLGWLHLVGVSGGVTV